MNLAKSIGEYLLKEQLDKVVKTLLEGLTTDGGHHKQFYLETALRQLCTDEWTDKAKEHFQWEEGIPN